MKVYISPTADQVSDDNGVGKVVLAQHKYLPTLGIEIVDNPDQADVINAHITDEAVPRTDVLSIHGLYWTGDKNSGRYSAWHHTANQKIIAAARRATELTVPSAWVGECFKRDMRRVPHVIGHGIDLAEWEPAEHKGYILWNKNRATDVCDPTPALELARRGHHVVTTFAPIGMRKEDLPATLHVIGGTLPHAKMKELIRHAELYLATTKETFGIGTLEALACGVPVVGYDWGGTCDVLYGKGYLAEPGNVEKLIEYVGYARRDRDRLVPLARDRAAEFSWANVMQQYVEVYQLALHKRQQKKEPIVSIVITNYNYEKYVSKAIQSAINQTLEPEIIVVDDGSTDNSDIVLSNYEFTNNVQVIHQDNQGVAAARNTGIVASRGDFIVCLDADDEVAERYVETLLPTLRNNPDIGVAYTGLALIDDSGKKTPNAWPPHFSWEAQTEPHNPPSNCIPCAAMFRRELWQKAGGYKQVYAPAEDAEFWTRGLSLGYKAQRVTDEALFFYRVHGDTSASRTKQYKPIDQWHPWMRDKQYPMAAPAAKSPLVRSYSEPLVSIVIPVGPGHAKYLSAALDSLLGQTFRNWEVIVVDDLVDPNERVEYWLNLESVYPFAKTAATLMPGAGAGAARNIGLELVRAPLVLFLDADDWLDPAALDRMLYTYKESGGKYVYSDWWSVEQDGVTAQTVPDYTREAWLQNGLHAVTALIETKWARKVGGFDVKIRGWEDWDFYIKLTIAGVCGIRIPEPLLYYRRYSGTWRNLALAAKDEKRNQLLAERYGDYVKGDKSMPGCCGGNGDTILQVKRALEPMTEQQVDIVPVNGVVRLEYIGGNVGSITFFGQKSRREYRGGNNPHDKYVDADPRDVEHLVNSGRWKIIALPQPNMQTVTFETILHNDPPPQPAIRTATREDIERARLTQPGSLFLDNSPEQVVRNRAAYDHAMQHIGELADDNDNESTIVIEGFMPDEAEQAAIKAVNAEVRKRGRPAKNHD